MLFHEEDLPPGALASGSQTIFWYRANVTPPKDYAKWEAFIAAFTGGATVDSTIVSGVGHSIDHHLKGASVQLHQIAFALDVVAGYSPRDLLSFDLAGSFAEAAARGSLDGVRIIWSPTLGIATPDAPAQQRQLGAADHQR